MRNEERGSKNTTKTFFDFVYEKSPLYSNLNKETIHFLNLDCQVKIYMISSSNLTLPSPSLQVIHNNFLNFQIKNNPSQGVKINISPQLKLILQHHLKNVKDF